MTHRITISALVLLLAPAGWSLAAAPAQGIGQVHGTVYGKERQGVPGLAVALVPDGGSSLHGTTTDMDGQYEFKGLDADVYTVMVAEPTGTIHRKDGIRVRALFRSIVDFGLAAEPPSSIATVPKPPAPAATDGETAGPETITLTCALAGASREPVPDASITMTPLDGKGAQSRCRTGLQGTCVLETITPGTYRLSVNAAGFINWSIGPLVFDRAGQMSFDANLTPYPMGFAGTVDDLLIPADPVPPKR